MKKHTLLTNDVETTSIWFNTLRYKTAARVLKEGMPALLDIYSKYGIKSTFFFTGYIVNLYPELVSMVVNAGHEVGSHGKSHLKENAFDVMPYERQLRHLVETKKQLEDLSGQEVLSFRAPALRVSTSTAQALIEAGYRIDSSVASRRFDFFLSFGGIKKLRWFFSPRLPYRTSPNSLFRKGDSPLIEVPLSAFFIPYLGTTMRIFPWITPLQRAGILLESNLNGKPVVFDIHPNELIDESDEPRVIKSRSGNKIAYFFQDWLRAQLKTKNLGAAAINLYEREIRFFVKHGYKFNTLKGYCKEAGLLV